MGAADPTAPGSTPILPPSVAHGGSRRRGGFVAAMLAGTLAFVALAVAAHRVAFFPIDLTLTRRAQDLHAAWFLTTLAALNRIGFPPLVDFIAAGIVLTMVVTGRRWHAVAATFAAVGIAALNFAVKAVVDRPRPPPDLVRVEHTIRSTSFPAGHVMTFMAFFGFLAWLAWSGPVKPWWRVTIAVVLVVAIALVGVSRIVAGEHWPSDVLGGYLLGALWLAVTVQFDAWGVRRAAARGRHA